MERKNLRQFIIVIKIIIKNNIRGLLHKGTKSKKCPQHLNCSCNYKLPAVASRLQIQGVVSAKIQKFRIREKWPGWLHFVTNCPGLLYFYHIKLIWDLEIWIFSVVGFLVGSNSVQSKSWVHNFTNRKPLKSYTNPPKITGLLPVLHEQFRLYIPKHGRALVPCRLVWDQILPENRIPRTRISLSPNFQANRTSSFRINTISI